MLDFVPVIDGGGYAVGLGGAVWYVNGPRASRVVGLPKGSGIGNAIVPSAAGGAYVLTFGDGLWFLDREVSTKVVEAPPSADVTPPRSAAERAMFVMWWSERRAATATIAANERNESAAESETFDDHSASERVR